MTTVFSGVAPNSAAAAFGTAAGVSGLNAAAAGTAARGLRPFVGKLLCHFDAASPAETTEGQSGFHPRSQ